jgi:hypothetical protein
LSSGDGVGHGKKLFVIISGMAIRARVAAPAKLNLHWRSGRHGSMVTMSSIPYSRRFPSAEVELASGTTPG